MRGWFVLGTDTGVGKSRVACALLEGVRREGLHGLGMKPVATGFFRQGDRWVNEDVELLKHHGDSTLKHSGGRVPEEWINPYGFEPPIAPHLAAHRQGVNLSFGVMRTAYQHLQSETDCLVVEGAGGVLVPLGEEGDMVDLAQSFALPVILVVGLRLGCLNHALLSAEALQHRSLPWAGWIANCLSPDLEEEEGQIRTLQARLPGPFLGRYPYGMPPELGYTALHWESLRKSPRSAV
ncbi:MAG: dethiobiotin synthase [Ferrovum myxofaciens]|uniref:dethiobiotin synthase n=1 Tax=Ferrovum myxofaciens TaxID=416213 RepID=UPI002355BD50|nr:dethiobiotin synthase [Ferrovum myxofaciens]QKE41824.1 MAG: dethiobiotin synthase [Ferrovum myxofaciens]